MTTLTVSSTGKSTLLRGFPLEITIDKPVDVAKVADVKAALATKFPKVQSSLRKFDSFTHLHAPLLHSSTSNDRNSRSRAILNH
jgi:hypothetical protein